MSTRGRLNLTVERTMSVSRFFQNVRNILAGQPPMDDNFDQGRGRPQGAADENAARMALGTDIAANTVYVPKPKPEPWQVAERA